MFSVCPSRALRLLFTQCPGRALRLLLIASISDHSERARFTFAPQFFVSAARLSFQLLPIRVPPPILGGSVGARIQFGVRALAEPCACSNKQIAEPFACFAQARRDGLLECLVRPRLACEFEGETGAAPPHGGPSRGPAMGGDTGGGRGGTRSRRGAKRSSLRQGVARGPEDGPLEFLGLPRAAGGHHDRGRKTHTGNSWN